MSVTVELITCERDLSDQDIERWNALAANPLQRWEWLGSWWRGYGNKRTLYILSVKRDGRIIAFAPWCIESRLVTGRTVQFLGSGKACTDHVSLLVQDDDIPVACEAIAGWLADVASEKQHALPSQLVWDSIEWIGVDRHDGPINCLVEAMKQRGLAVEQREGMACYAIELPGSWDEYVQLRSRSGRREVRKALNTIEEGILRVTHIRDEPQLQQFWPHFVDLHQRRRRQAAGTSGCFDDQRFAVFLRAAASRLLEAGLLEFLVASRDGVPVAVQLAVADDRTWYFYQSGMEPDAADVTPGLSLLSYSIRTALESGRQRFDMMRGDESYKLRWRAELQPAQEIRVCSPSWMARLRNQVYHSGLALKHLIRSGIGLVQASS